MAWRRMRLASFPWPSPLGRSHGSLCHRAAASPATELWQSVSLPREIGELELDFENPTWKSNRDFQECTVKFIVKTIANLLFTLSIALKKLNSFVPPRLYKTTKKSREFILKLSKKWNYILNVFSLEFRNSQIKCDQRILLLNFFQLKNYVKIYYYSIFLDCHKKKSSKIIKSLSKFESFFLKR